MQTLQRERERERERALYSCLFRRLRVGDESVAQSGELLGFERTAEAGLLALLLQLEHVREDLASAQLSTDRRLLVARRVRRVRRRRGRSRAERWRLLHWANGGARGVWLIRCYGIAREMGGGGRRSEYGVWRSTRRCRKDLCPGNGQRALQTRSGARLQNVEHRWGLQWDCRTDGESRVIVRPSGVKFWLSRFDFERIKIGGNTYCIAEKSEGHWSFLTHPLCCLKRFLQTKQIH